MSGSSGLADDLGGAALDSVELDGGLGGAPLYLAFLDAALLLPVNIIRGAVVSITADFIVPADIGAFFVPADGGPFYVPKGV